MSRIKRTFVALSLLVLLGGCSGAEDRPGAEAGAPQVASLRSDPAPSSAPAVRNQRPIVPIDATEEDLKKLALPWAACLHEENPSVYTGGPDTYLSLYKGVDQTEPAVKACLPKQPEFFDEHLLRTDPSAFKDNQREWYRCAQAAGYKLTAPDPDTGQFGITEVGPNGDFGSEKMQECRRQAFAN